MTKSCLDLSIKRPRQLLSDLVINIHKIPLTTNICIAAHLGKQNMNLGLEMGHKSQNCVMVKEWQP